MAIGMDIETAVVAGAAIGAEAGVLMGTFWILVLWLRSSETRSSSFSSS
jgi:hypothetical protein